MTRAEEYWEKYVGNQTVEGLLTSDGRDPLPKSLDEVEEIVEVYVDQLQDIFGFIDDKWQNIFNGLMKHILAEQIEWGGKDAYNNLGD